ncbi:MAG: dihydropteroate synthase [Candidatus Aphodosoma sp.]|nr:dihydropteroate synthase [Candidatus Aphodosoma sp.]
MDNVVYSKNIVIKGNIIDTSNPIVMAIINSTPDSFYSGSRHSCKVEVKKSAEKAIKDGASILDVGGYSTRPGAPEVSEQEEIDRVCMALEAIREDWPKIPISVDTFRSSVAKISVKEFKADIINDVYGGEIDKTLFSTMAELQVPYILMHSKGTPQTMQSMTDYSDFESDVLKYFSQKIKELRDAGFNKEIIIDPGYGFAKTVEQNYQLLNDLEIFECFNAPILVGISRKSMIFKPLETTPLEALNGTTILNTFAIERGANILRVHDVKEAMEVIKLHNLLKGKR